MSQPASPVLRVGLLGPLRLSCADRSATPSAPKLRSVLALLLTSLNQGVPLASLTKELWGDRPPVSALTTVQTYVLHLRKLLASALDCPAGLVARTVLVTQPGGGYMFVCAAGHCDLDAYEQLTLAGRSALAAGKDTLAADLFQQSLGLWQGRPLDGVRHGPVLEPWIRRLEESRLATIEQGIEARLRLGRHHELLPELAGLVAQHRLHENLHAQFMIALHRSGRRQDALSVFQRLRMTMHEELGMEPCRRLHALQQAILNDDPGLEVAPRADGLAQFLDQVAAR